jgi:thiamine biosynthesis protein ThiI
VDRFIVIHYNELGLKKGNRDFFENALCANINAVVQDCGAERVKRISGRHLLPLKPDADLPEIRRRLARVFGIAFFAEAWACSRTVENLQTDAWSLIRGQSFKSFRIDTRRGDKSFPLTSVEINQHVGAYVKERSGARVDLENAELTCWIEIVERNALLYTERLPGPGGLPVGTSGKVAGAAFRRHRFAGRPHGR